MDFTPVLTSLSALFSPSSLTAKSPVPLTVMILSPHPDDESIVGSLALRLKFENSAKVINVAVTTGSNRARQKERMKELNAACELLKMECVYLGEDWKRKEKELKSLLEERRPQLIIAPHVKDFHPTHMKTGELLKKCLISSKKIRTLVAWSEFWAPLQKPNVLVEVPQEILELQMRALEKHVGEISRNPYHLRLPAWMMDNVRRGSELISGTGETAANMAFGVLYRLQLFKERKFTTPKIPPFLSTGTDIGQILRLMSEAASGSKTKVK